MSVKRIVGVYKLYDDKHVYIGASMSCTSRWWQHKRFLLEGNHIYTKELTPAYKTGELKFEILEKLPNNCTRKRLHEREQHWMDKFPERINKSRNVTLKGYVTSEESRLKKSKSHTGVPLSAEHRKNIGLGNLGNKKFLGHKHSPETIAKMRNRKHTPEAIDKMRKANENYYITQGNPRAMQGKKHSPETLKRMSEARIAYWANRRASKSPAS